MALHRSAQGVVRVGGDAAGLLAHPQPQRPVLLCGALGGLQLQHDLTLDRLAQLCTAYFERL